MKNILIPTDFSDDSLNAIHYALELFKDRNCNFYLLHVNNRSDQAMDDFTYVPAPEAVMNDPMLLSKTRLQKLIKGLGPLTNKKNHTFFLLNDHGYFVECIRKHVLEKKINLIVMGTKGASGVLQHIIGSNTGDVITKVKCNTLAVPSKSIFKGVSEIAFPTDYSIFYSSDILRALSELMEIHKAHIRVMHASKGEQKLTPVQYQNKEYLQDYLVGNFGANSSFHIVTNKNVTAAVQCFVESRNIDMIVMVAKNLNFLQQLLFNSKVEEVSFHTKIPFLVVHG